MAHLYIIKNSAGKYYVGITELDPDERLKRHNGGDVSSTRYGKSWRIVYTESCANMVDGRKREKQIKSWHGGGAFRKLVSGAAGSANGRQPDSESGNLGSNPSPAAVDVSDYKSTKTPL